MFAALGLRRLSGLPLMGHILVWRPLSENRADVLRSKVRGH